MTVKEAPARRGLRSVFAGLFGRGKSAAAPKASAPKANEAGHVKVIAPETVVAETVEPETVVAETATSETVVAETATPETATPETVVAETATPETVVAETATPETATPETVVAETATPKTVVAETDVTEAALPLPSYDTLTIASLKARLRNLTTDDLAVLIDYEKAHQGREEVITMFERRVAKIAAGLTTGFPAIS